MLQPCVPFDVIVSNPAKPAKEGDAILKQGDRLTVRAIVAEHRLDGVYSLFFLVWNEARRLYMLEPSWQFSPVEHTPQMKIPRGKK